MCKLKPPKVFAVPAPPPRMIAFEGVRPNMQAIDWCGKHERKEELTF